MPETPRKVVLAYSGGLDTSVILTWLIERYGCEVIAMTADLGQGRELSGLREKALAAGASKVHVEDLREAFVRDYCFPTMRAGAVYEGRYLLGTSFSRPLIAKRQVEIARLEGADAVAHGATGKGNDQVRFELAYAALAPELKVIAPWREWDLRGREDAMDYAAAHGIPVPVTREEDYSRDGNLWHLSHEGGPLEDPAFEADARMFQRTAAPEEAPEEAEYVTIGFEAGWPVAVDGERLGPVALLERLNALGGRHGVGRRDIVESRVVGMKSRGVYETPGGTMLYEAHRDLEALVLDRDTSREKRTLSERYAELVYAGKWFSPLREALDAFVDTTQKRLTGTVRLKLYKGSVTAVGRESPYSLFRKELVTFGRESEYDQADATGFIRLFGLPERTQGLVDRAAERGEGA